MSEVVAVCVSDASIAADGASVQYTGQIPRDGSDGLRAWRWGVRRIQDEHRGWVIGFAWLVG